MDSGSITLNGINDAELIMILKQKEKDTGLVFTPNTLQPLTQKSIRHPNGQVIVQQYTGPQLYNNAALSWTTPEGLKSVYTILHKLLHGHDKEPG